MIQVALPVEESYQNPPFGGEFFRPEIGDRFGAGQT
jgi:hypothetical protein